MPLLHEPECACVLLTVQAAGDGTVHTGDDYQRHTWQSTTSLVPLKVYHGCPDHRLIQP
jgi:hypothetical protein